MKKTFYIPIGLLSLLSSSAIDLMASEPEPHSPKTRTIDTQTVASPAATGERSDSAFSRSKGDFVWYAVAAESYDEVCFFNADGSRTCVDSCPADLQSICAEFSSYRHTQKVCCIPANEVGTDDPSSCLLEVELIRSDIPPVELTGSIPQKQQLSSARSTTAEPEPPAQAGLEPLSDPLEDFDLDPATAAKTFNVSSSLLVVGEREPSTKSGTTFETFPTTPGVGFSLMQVTSQYPLFSPATFIAPSGARYEFSGSSVTCDSGPCGSHEVNLEKQALVDQAAAGMVIFSIAGSEVLGGSWQLALQSPPPNLQAKSRPQIEHVIAFDDVAVEIVVDPDPGSCLGDSICHPNFDSLKTHPGLELIDGAAPVLGLAAQAKNEDGAVVSLPLSLTSLSLQITERNTGRQVFAHDYSLGEVAGVKKNAAGYARLPLTNLATGSYEARLDLEAIVEGVGPIKRTAFYPLPILARSHRLTGAAQGQILQ